MYAVAGASPAQSRVALVAHRGFYLLSQRLRAGGRPVTTRPTRAAALGKLLAAAVDASLAFLRKADPDAAADVDALRRRELTRPSVVVVGETKRHRALAAFGLADDHDEGRATSAAERVEVGGGVRVGLAQERQRRVDAPVSSLARALMRRRRRAVPRMRWDSR